MTEQPPGQDRSDDWGRGYIPGEQYAGEQYYGPGGSGSSSSRPGQGTPGQGGSGYGTPAPGGSGYGASGPGGSGAARPAPGMPTAPVWQATPGAGGQAPGAPGQAGPAQGGPPPMGAPSMAQPMMGSSQAADARGFLGALFDFSFTSFVTTRIIKVLYVLILVMTCITALVYTFLAFQGGALFGLLTLVIGDPLFIIIVMALWRLVLESFVVRFRIAEDVRALRERGGR